MGTNYYLHDGPPCPTCGHEKEPLHIGKSSAGWVFSLRIHPDEDILTLVDWEARWHAEGARIVDEYGRELTEREMRRVVRNRGSAERVHRRSQHWYEENEAEPGPRGLARCRIGRFCSAHGDGTWDYMIGEFS